MIVQPQRHNSGKLITRSDPVLATVFSKVTVSGSGSTTSATYVDYPGAIDLTFVKREASTAMLAVGAVSAYKTAGTALMHIGLRINSVDYDLNQFFFNTLSEHNNIPFSRLVAQNLAPGTYAARVRWRIPGGTTGNADTNDTAVFTLTEVRVG